MLLGCEGRMEGMERRVGRDRKKIVKVWEIVREKKREIEREVY